MSLLGCHVLSTQQFDRSLLERVFAVARTMEPISNRRVKCRVLEGAVLANLFFEPSTRTRISFGAAFARMGGAVVDTTGLQSCSIAKGESLSDMGQVISGYADVIVARHPEVGAVEQIAKNARVPVINGGDGPGEHPTQALLDIYTVQKELAARGRTLDGMRIALVGDLKYGRTVHSLVRLLSHQEGLRFLLVSPHELRMPPEIVRLARERGHVVQEANSMPESLEGCDVLYLTRMQVERFNGPEESVGITTPYRVNRRFIEERCHPGVIIMHPLPRDSRKDADELSTDVDHHAGAAIFRQTDNGMPVRMALFAMILGVEERIEAHYEALSWKVRNGVQSDAASTTVPLRDTEKPRNTGMA